MVKLMSLSLRRDPMYKFFFVIFSLSAMIELNAEFLNNKEFDRERGIPDPSTRGTRQPARQTDERQSPYYPVALDQAEYYRDVEMPAPNAGINYLREDHPLQENQLQEDPDL